jgi:NhaA family Na+:H+ antiporter
MFAVVPLFGFVSAGTALPTSAGELARPLPLAILLGLFLGKQLGVFGAIWLAVRAGVAPRPQSASWRHLYGAAILCGIGFTMSLFIGALAFRADPELIEEAKVGTLAGSLLSALFGYLLLRTAPTVAGRERDGSGEADELFAADEQD